MKKSELRQMIREEVKLLKEKKEEYILPDTLKLHWGNGRPLSYKGKNWTVGKMSYGDYFLQPAGYEAGEREPFHEDTIWLQKKLIKNQYGVNQPVYVEEK